MIGFVHAEQLLDRVVARVGGTAVTQTDVEAAVALGVVQAQSASDTAALRQMIDRQLLLAEVARFPPTEPPDAAVNEAVARMKARAGSGYAALLRRTGLDEQRVREIARDTLRIDAYVDQRFGTAQTPERRSQMMAQWLEDLRTRGDIIEVPSRQP